MLFRHTSALALAGALLPAAPSGASAQNAGTVPNVFIDCNARNCDQTYFRTEIDWVNWVRDREASDVHLIFTSEDSGGGGEIYQLDFIGIGSAEGYQETLRIPTIGTDTEREQLDQIVDAMALALAQFAVAEGFRDLVDIQIAGLRGLGDEMVEPEEVNDPWNLWTFNINANANISGEDTRENRNLRAGFNASRVSPTWKLNVRGNINNRLRVVELTDEPDFRDERTDWGINGLAVYSIAPKISVGARGEVRRIVSANQRFRWELTPAVEYSFFPYEDATRRSLTLYYQVGPAYRDYIETTALGQDDELRFEHALEVELSQRQTWGDASIRARGSQFLHDTSLYNVSLRGDLEFRVARGFSISTEGNVSWVEDQIYISAQGATSAEELLDLVRRGQSFAWSYEIGFNFRFGSIFNNVVNNRFGGGFWFF